MSSIYHVIATASLTSSAPYSASRYHDTPKLHEEAAASGKKVRKESDDEWEERTWRSRLHLDDAGKVVIPFMAFKKALDGAASRLGMPIPRGKNRTYAKPFVSGVMVTESLHLGIDPEDVPGERLFMSATGDKRGGGTRVWRKYPYIAEWGGDVQFHIFDEVITEDVFRKHLEAAGILVGIGRWRPENGGVYGRFDVGEVKWEYVD